MRNLTFFCKSLIFHICTVVITSYSLNALKNINMTILFDQLLITNLVKAILLVFWFYILVFALCFDWY